MDHNNKTFRLIQCGLFSALIAAGAFIKIPIPVVPFTLQFLFTNLAGLLLGKKYGATAVGIYLFLGLLGLPIFTGGGGIHYIAKPTFGYLIGFVAGAFVAGFFVEKKYKGSPKTLLFAGILNLGIVYLFGLIYCYLIMLFYVKQPISIGVLFLTGFLMAIPGDIVLCILCVFLAKHLRPVLQT